MMNTDTDAAWQLLKVKQNLSFHHFTLNFESVCTRFEMTPFNSGHERILFTCCFIYFTQVTYVLLWYNKRCNDNR